MKKLSLISKVLVLAALVCLGVIAWDLVQTGTLPDPTTAAREAGISLQEQVRQWFEGLR